MVLKQIQNSFFTKFKPESNDRKSSFNVRQILGMNFLPVICSQTKQKLALKQT